MTRRKKGILERVFVDLPINVVEGTTKFLWGSDEPSPPARQRQLQRCPVCEGRGKVYSGFYDGLPKTYAFESCRTCGGRGAM